MLLPGEFASSGFWPGNERLACEFQRLIICVCQRADLRRVWSRGLRCVFCVKACPQGFFCPNSSSIQACPQGSFCKAYTLLPKRCPWLAKCRTGSGSADLSMGGFLGMLLILLLLWLGYLAFSAYIRSVIPHPLQLSNWILGKGTVTATF